MYDSIIILGPTATGKTRVSIELAKKLNTEIINADSMYIYRNLDIGTAKPDLNEMDGVIHHLIGFLDPDQTYNVSEYRDDVKVKLELFKANGKLPIIVGGTGLYIDSLINNFSYGQTSRNNDIRSNLQNLLDSNGKEYLYDMLKSCDPDTYAKLHINDTKRIIRALEICLSSNIKKSDIINTEDPLLKNPLIIGLNIDRDILYDRINKRVDIMINNGLIHEVKHLCFDLHLNPEEHQSMKGIGYKELVSYLKHECTLPDAIDKIKQHSRNYAKRQITWFKRNEKIIWLNPLDENIVDKILKLLGK